MAATSQSEVTTEITLRLTEEAVQDLEEMAESRGGDIGRVIVEALGLDRFVWKTQREGGKVLIKNRDGVIELEPR